MLVALNNAFAELLREDEEDIRRRKYMKRHNDMIKQIKELTDKAEKRFLRNPIADYEEICYYMNSTLKEVLRYNVICVKWFKEEFYISMNNSDLKKELDYCKYLVNIKKKIKEND